MYLDVAKLEKYDLWQDQRKSNQWFMTSVTKGMK